MTKRILAVILALSMICGLAACGDATGSSKPAGTDKNSETVSSSNSTSSDDVSSDETESSDDTDASNGPTAVTSTYTVTETDLIKLDIDNSKALNKEWNGVNGIHQGFIFLPDDYGRGYTDEQIAEELKRMEDMDINMVRSYFDPGYAFESRSGMDITYDWDNERMQGFYKWLSAMEERNIEVAVNMGWGVGSLINSSTDHLRYDLPWYGMDYDDKLAAYADWVVKVVEEVKVKRGYRLDYLVMFTEPYHHQEYTVSIDGESFVKNGWELAIDMVEAAHNALVAAGLRDLVKITGPQVAITSEFYEGETLEEEINWWIDHVDGFVDIYTFHWYVPTWPGSKSNSNADFYDDNYDLWVYYLEKMVELIAKTGKPFWFDEWNYGGQVMETQKEDFYAQQIAQTVVAAMNAGVNNIIYWQLFETVWPTRFDTGGEFEEGIHIIGTTPSLYTSSIPYKLYYGFTLLAKYCGELDSTVYLGEGRKGVCCSMVEYEKDGKTYQNIIVVNSSSIEKKISLNFENSIGKNMYRYLFDPLKTTPTPSARIISADKGFTDVTTTLQDTIPAGSIVVYSTVKN